MNPASLITLHRFNAATMTIESTPYTGKYATAGDIKKALDAYKCNVTGWVEFAGERCSVYEAGIWKSQAEAREARRHQEAVIRSMSCGH